MITKDSVKLLLEDGRTHRKQFSVNSGIQKNKPRPTFSVPFDNGLLRHFRDGTGLFLKWNPDHDQHYCFLQDQSKIDVAEGWEVAQGTRVFIRNLMSSSLALDINLVDNTSGKKTHTGLLEEQAKHHQDQKSIAELVRISVETVKSISYLQECDVLMAVPAMLNKGFDLPRELAKGISTGIGKPNMTPNFLLEGKQGSAKAVDLSQKWDVWASCLFRYDGSSLARRRVMLVDDKYQSGVTMQFWAAELLKMGASEAHGLSMVKTLRDTDNQ